VVSNMPPPAVLLAETDPRTLDRLPRILLVCTPHLAIDCCSSVDELSRKLKESSYTLVVADSVLIQPYLVCKKRSDQLLAPCILTASAEDRAHAFTALQSDAFDMIVKPIVNDRAVETVKLALWHHWFLQLLASPERAIPRFQAHLAAFPHNQDTEGAWVTQLATFERTLKEIITSGHHWSAEEESVLFDIATTVETITRQRALERLLTLCQGGHTQ
jgi:DNA-binding response OmpR family regulator